MQHLFYLIATFETVPTVEISLIQKYYRNITTESSYEKIMSLRRGAGTVIRLQSALERDTRVDRVHLAGRRNSRRR